MTKDIFDYIENSRRMRSSGVDLEYYQDEQGLVDIRPYVEPTLLENIGEGLQRVAGTTASIGAGAFGATAGFPTDLASLFISIGESVGAEDGKKLETFANTFETLSKENYGSQFYKGLFDNFIDDLKISDQKKKDFKAGFVGGEFLGVGNIGGQAAKKAPAVAKSIKETSEEVGEAAQKRVDENQGSMTMSSMGVGEMGKMVDKGLSKLAPNKGEVINLKPKVDRLNFYSKAEEVTNQLKQNKGTGQQYRQQLLKAGVKPDEIEWLGLDDVLKKGKITKQELQDQINANRIELDEVELSGGGDDVLDGLASRFNENETVMSAEDAYGPRYLNERADEIFQDVDEIDEGGRKLTIDDAYEQAKNEYDDNPIMKYVDPETGYTITGNDDVGYSIFRSEADSSNFRNAVGYNEAGLVDPRDVPYSLNEAVIRAEGDMMDRGAGAGMVGGTRFGENTEPGGDNYREFLIRYDNPRERNEVQFDDDHFGIPGKENVIAHFRTKDRTTSDGKKVFYIEEIQSDWGQQFRTQKGFLEFGLTGITGTKDMPKILNEFTIRRPSTFGGPIKDNNYYDWFKSTQNTDTLDMLTTPLYRRLYRNFLIDTGIKNKNGQVATFEEKLKVLKDQGIDVRQGPPKAPFITNTDKWTQLTLKRILSKAVDEGYDFVSITPGKAQMDRWNDEGVAKFYDEIVPKNAEKIVKKLDKNAIQKDKEINIPSPFKSVRELHSQTEREFGKRPKKRFSIALTPQLKEKVKKGMAMFSATPLVVGQENE